MSRVASSSPRRAGHVRRVLLEPARRTRTCNRLLTLLHAGNLPDGKSWEKGYLLYLPTVQVIVLHAAGDA